ncbi:cell division protein FtsA [Treponema sp.]|uniref:cell division protein FtsA n=1 Tax=Treponema sp. TaxID=166 RepID=UPI0038906F72
MRNALSRRIVGLDIGTCYIRTVIAEIDSDGRIEVIGLSKIPSQGVRNGIIVNIDATKEAVQTAIEAAEQMAGVEVTDLYTTIGGAQVSSMKSTGVVGVDPKGLSTMPLEIKPEAKERALKSAKSMLIPYDEALLHIIPQEYLIDGKDYPDPIGNLGVRLEVKTLLVKVSKSSQGNIAECIARAGFELKKIMLKTLAAATATIHKDELALGSILIDLGGGSTDVIVINKSAPVFTASIPYGGNRVTNDIAQVLGVPFSVAEDLKLKYGSCWLEPEEEEDEVIIPSVGGLPPAVTNKKLLCDIISSRVEEILVSVKKEVVRHSGLKRLNGTIVLTGGGALMPGVVTLSQAVWNSTSVGQGTCSDFGGADTSYRNADFATVMGLVMTYKDDDSRASSKRSAKKQGSEPKKSFIKNLLKKIN